MIFWVSVIIRYTQALESSKFALLILSQSFRSQLTPLTYILVGKGAEHAKGKNSKLVNTSSNWQINPL